MLGHTRDQGPSTFDQLFLVGFFIREGHADLRDKAEIYVYDSPISVLILAAIERPRR
jgi:hypothetical protein